MFEVNSYEELTEKIKICFESKIEVMIQEKIPGKDSCMYSHNNVISKKGKLLSEIVHNTRRQTPPMFGVTRVGKTVSVHPQMKRDSTKILKHVDYSGIASVQYKKDPRDGIFKLIEVNSKSSNLESDDLNTKTKFTGTITYIVLV